MKPEIRSPKTFVQCFSVKYSAGVSLIAWSRRSKRICRIAGFSGDGNQMATSTIFSKYSSPDSPNSPDNAFATMARSNASR